MSDRYAVELSSICILFHRFYGVHSQQQLSNNIRIHFLEILLGFQTLRNIHLTIELRVPVIDIFSFIVYSLDADEKRNSPSFFSHILRYSPIEMHNCIIRFINPNVIRNITTKNAVWALIVDINGHRRHVMIIPISRTIKRNGLDVMIILNCDSFELVWNSDATITSNYNMWFYRRLSS